MKELNCTDLKMDIESLKKPQKKTVLEMENNGKRTGVINASIINRIQDTEERISAAEETIENIDITVKGSKSSYLKTFKKSRTQ